MRVFKTRTSLIKWREKFEGRVGFVPTMGALHEGHLELVRRSLTQTQATVVSIFVNPLQFGPQEDLSRYPRTEKEDLRLLKKEGVDAVFIPQSVSEVYPAGKDETIIHPRKRLTTILEGIFRPGHFEGVATVVHKLFMLVKPKFAYFGEKDYQQVCVIESMIEDLFLPIRLVRVPTLREASGLALSSRNRYLSDDDRNHAAILATSLRTSENTAGAKAFLRSHGFDVQYLERWNDALTATGDRWLVAAFYKGVRLIDNWRR